MKLPTINYQQASLSINSTQAFSLRFILNYVWLKATDVISKAECTVSHL